MVVLLVEQIEISWSPIRVVCALQSFMTILRIIAVHHARSNVIAAFLLVVKLRALLACLAQAWC
jgi:hypothetical protein